MRTIEGSVEDADEQEQRWSTWMQAAQTGDRKAYHQLLGELENALVPFLRRQLGGSDLVEDCVQEALLAIHRARHTYDPKRPFKPWAYTLARYKSVDAIRRHTTRRRHESPSEIDPDAWAGTAEGPDPRIDAARALGSLAADHREAVILTKLQGYTVEEAAERAGISHAAMRSRLHRGLRTLKVQLERAFAREVGPR